MSSNTPINDTNTLNHLSSNIRDAIMEQVSDENSILREKLEGKKFSDTIQIQLTLRETFREIWKKGGEISAKFGFLGDPEILEKEHYKLQAELDTLSKNIYTLLEEAIVEDTSVSPAQYEIRIDDVAIQNIANRLERELPGIREPKHLKAKETNQLEAITEARLIAMLEQAPKKLRGELRTLGYPSHIKNQKLYEGKVFKGLETGLLTGSIMFMTYGWHGLIYNRLDDLYRNDVSQGIATQIMTTPALQNSLTWGGGFLAATLIATGLLKGAQKRREYLIKDAEASYKAGKDVKVGNAVQRNGLFASCALVALLGAGLEGAGILSHEVQGIYTAQKAHEVGLMIHSILDTSNSESAGGKLAIELANMQGEIENNATEWYNAEVSRPGATGIGPAAVAKQYLKDGKAPLDYTTLGKDSTLKNLVDTTDAKIAQILPTIYNTGKTTFPLQADAISDRYTVTTRDMANTAYGEVTFDEEGKQKTGLYRSVYEKGKKANTEDFKNASKQFEAELKKYQEYMNRLNNGWKETTQVYKNYIDQVSAISDARYNSKLNVRVPVPNIHIDLSEIERKIKEEPPKLEGKTPLEYYHELERLTGVEGGITTGERVMLLTLVSLRSGIIELIAIIMLLIGVNRVTNHYKLNRNLLSEREKEIVDTHYENLVTAIENTFSGGNWTPIFPDNEGISREEADYLARKLLVSQDPTLDKWLPIRHESGEHVHITRKYGKKVSGLYKKILTGDTTTEAELRINTINDVLSELASKARKDKSGLGIPLKDALDLVRTILPDPKIKGSKNTAVDIFSDKVSQIATNLDKITELTIQTQGQDTTERTVAFESSRQDMEDWAMNELDIWLGQCETTIQSQTTVNPNLSDFVRDGRQFQTEIQSSVDLTGTWIASMRKGKQKLLDMYESL